MGIILNLVLVVECEADLAGSWQCPVADSFVRVNKYYLSIKFGVYLY
jgi:hypothetical protein